MYFYRFCFLCMKYTHLSSLRDFVHRSTLAVDRFSIFPNSFQLFDTYVKSEIQFCWRDHSFRFTYGTPKKTQWTILCRSLFTGFRQLNANNSSEIFVRFQLNCVNSSLRPRFRTDFGIYSKLICKFEFFFLFRLLCSQHVFTCWSWKSQWRHMLMLSTVSISSSIFFFFFDVLLQLYQLDDVLTNASLGRIVFVPKLVDFCFRPKNLDEFVFANFVFRQTNWVDRKKKYLNLFFRFGFPFRINGCTELNSFVSMFPRFDRVSCYVSTRKWNTPIECVTNAICLPQWITVCRSFISNIFVFFVRIQFFLFFKKWNSPFENRFLVSRFPNTVKLICTIFRQILFKFTILFSPFHWRRWTKM